MRRTTSTPPPNGEASYRLRLFATRATAVVVALASTLTVADPASAFLSGGGGSCGYGTVSQTCSGLAQDVPGIGSSGTDVQVTCNATTQAYVQATAVQCYIQGTNGDKHYTNPVWTQGQTSSLTFTFDSWVHNLTSRSYVLCVQAGYISGDGYTFVPRYQVCNPGI